MMEDEELINKMREAVMTEKQIAWAGKSAEYQAVNDACLKSLANMVQQHFIEQACEAIDYHFSVKNYPFAGAAQQAIRDRFDPRSYEDENQAHMEDMANRSGTDGKGGDY